MKSQVSSFWMITTASSSSKEFAPVIGKMPNIAYIPFHKKMAKDVIGYVVGKGYCTQEAADALVAKVQRAFYDK